jgi:hypothetical protein
MARVNLNNTQITLTAQRLALPVVTRTVNEVHRGARFLAPEGDHLSGSGKIRAGLPLKNSSFQDIIVGPQRILGKVSFKARHSLVVHQGSRPHVILSKRGKMLKFRWDRGDFLVAARAGRRRGNRRTGAFHYFVQVRHPGNRNPVRYLTTPLHMFGRINGFRVSTVGTGVSHLP